MQNIQTLIRKAKRKLLWERFLSRLGVCLAWAGVAGVAGVLAWKFLAWQMPVDGWVGAGILAGAAVIGAGVWTMVRTPKPLEVAGRIDEVLNLKETVSTAVYLEKSAAVKSMAVGAKENGSDMASAALRHAGKLAGGVKLDGVFVPRWQRQHTLAGVLAAVAFGSALVIPEMDLLAREQKAREQVVMEVKRQAAEETARKALAAVYQAVKVAEEDKELKAARHELEELLSRPISDPGKAQRTAMKAAEEAKNAVAKAAKASQAAERAEAMKKNMAMQLPDPADKSDVAEARRQLASGDPAQAMETLKNAVKELESMSAEEKEKMAEQVRQMAKQLAENANSQQVQKNIEAQLKQMGADQQLAKKMARQMADAAQGDAQAAQDLQQQMQQMMQGLSPDQQQSLNEAMQRMQAGAKNAAQQENMAQAAEKLAKAMEKAAQQQQQQQAQNGQQQSGQKGGEKGEQGQGEQAQAQQGGGESETQSSMDELGQAMQQMQAVMEEAQAMADAQAAASAAAAGAASSSGSGGMPGGNGEGGQDGSMAGGGEQGGQGGQWGQAGQGQPGGGQCPHGCQGGNCQHMGQGGNGMAGGGPGSGDRSAKADSPFGTTVEKSPQQLDDRGRLLAVTLIRAGALRGEAKEQLKEVALVAEQQQADDVSAENVSRAAQNTVKNYFRSIAEGGSGGGGGNGEKKDGEKK